MGHTPNYEPATVRGVILGAAIPVAMRLPQASGGQMILAVREMPPEKPGKTRRNKMTKTWQGLKKNCRFEPILIINHLYIYRPFSTLPHEFAFAVCIVIKFDKFSQSDNAKSCKFTKFYMMFPLKAPFIGHPAIKHIHSSHSNP